MFRKKQYCFAAGQSLVEVVVAVGVVILLVTGLIVGSTNAIRGGEFGIIKSRAIKYAQEGIELSRSLRDSGWAAFATKSGVWCLDKTGVWTQAVAGACPVNVDVVFTRMVTFTWDAAGSRMKVDVNVSWNDGNGVHTSEIITYFTQWK